MVFQKRFLLETDDVFQELQNVRRSRCVSLLNIHRKTKIPLKYLRALEEGNIKMLPDVLYVKNIIKKYLEFFGIDAKPYLVKLDIKAAENKYPERIINHGPLVVVPRVIKTVLAIILVLGFVGFWGYQINKIFLPPKIDIYFPAEGFVSATEIISVQGRTQAGTNISVNDERVVLDKNNEFVKEINLQKGLNTIKISGVGKYSKENVIWRKVVLEIK
jgi:hypothetical protein